LIRIDMSEYMDKISVSRLIWSPPGYVWYEEGWQLTEAVRRKPYSIILFDEIEKAHPDVANVLLQILDDWSLTDWKWKKVNFKNTVIIITSNLWWNLNIDKTLDKTLDKNKNEKLIIEELKKFFRPELINRVDDIVLFNSLWENEIWKIAYYNLWKVKESLENKWIMVEFDDSVKEYLMKEWFDPVFWARPMKRAIKSQILRKISEKMLKWEISENKSYIIKMKDWLLDVSLAK
jgi:ATP-dependent Clp protease ATP-binding subunit ClpA